MNKAWLICHDIFICEISKHYAQWLLSPVAAKVPTTRETTP